MCIVYEWKPFEICHHYLQCAKLVESDQKAGRKRIKEKQFDKRWHFVMQITA